MGDCEPILPGEMDQTTVHSPSLTQSHNLWPHMIEILEQLVYIIYLMLNLPRASDLLTKILYYENLELYGTCFWALVTYVREPFLAFPSVFCVV